MSQENVETLKAAYEAFNRPDLDAALQYSHPDVEVLPGVPTPDSDARYLGRSGLKEFWRSIVTEPWALVPFHY